MWNEEPSFKIMKPSEKDTFVQVGSIDVKQFSSDPNEDYSEEREKISEYFYNTKDFKYRLTTFVPNKKYISSNIECEILAHKEEIISKNKAFYEDTKNNYGENIALSRIINKIDFS